MGLTYSIFSTPGPFYWDDAVNHFFLIQKYSEGRSVLNYTVNSTATGSFYPFYAMYGGTLYGLTAGVGRLLGSDWFAYGLTYLLAIGAACGGLVWLGHLSGLRARMAVSVSLVYLTSAYYLTNLYGRGAWPEFISTSAFPLVLAAGVSVLTAHHPSRRAMAMFIISTVVWSGSHLISTLYGILFGIVFGLVLAIASSTPRAWPRKRNALLVAAAACAAFAINAWFLLPQAVYARSTLVSKALSNIQYTRLTHLPVLFSPFPRVSPISTTPHLYTNLPVFPLLWAVSILYVSRQRILTRRLTWLISALLGICIILMSWHRTWAAVPHFLYIIQFPYRLLTYATLLECALIVVACRAVSAMKGKARQRWILAGGVIVLCQVCFATFQIEQSRGSLGYVRAEIKRMTQEQVPPHFYSVNDYRFIPDHPIVGISPSATFATVLRSDGNASVNGIPAPGDRIALDIPDSPFIAVRGATRAGATPDGRLVIDVDGAPSEIVIERALPAPAIIGQWLTILGTLLSVLLIAGVPRFASGKRHTDVADTSSD